MPSHLHLAHRRSARNAAKGRTVKQDDNLKQIRKRCKEDFGFFCEYISEGKKKPAAHHKEWIEKLVTEENSTCLLRIAGKDTAILAPRGPLHPDTLVTTPSGWRQLKDIKTGDVVYGDDGLPTTVIKTFDYEETDVYKVIFSDGTSLICDDSHRFDVRRMGTDPKNTYRKTTLQDIRTFVTTGTQGNWRTGVNRTVRLAEEGERPWLDSRGHGRYQVPVSKPIQYQKADLLIHPYLLGVLLGGKKLNDKINIPEQDKDIIDFINTIISNDYSSNSKELLAKQINNLGLFGKKLYDKFIPEQYLRGSIEQREWLLRGLMDTDGTQSFKSKSGKGGLSFNSSSKQLIDGITELVRSLGGIVTHGKPYYPHYFKSGEKIVSSNLSYRVGIRLPENIKPFYCKRKASKYKGSASKRSNGGLVRSIVDIQYVGKSKVKCISVDNKQQRFIIDDYIVSSNSSKSTSLGLFTAWTIGIHAEAKIPLKILYISYTVDVARPKSAAIKNTVGSKRYQEIFPSVRLKKGATSSEYWSIDYKHAGIEETGDEQFTVCCAGLKGSITSKRASLIIIDDCIKAAADIKNAEVRREMQDNWNSVISPTMFEGARAICLGTRFRHDDIFATTFIEKNGWDQVVQQALITDDQGNYQSYWPEMWSLEYLLKKKQIAPISFSFQYMNQIVRQSELSLSPDLLIRSEIATEFDTIGIGVDLSSGLKDKNDYTVMTLGGRIGDKIHIIDYRRFRSMGNLEKLDKMMELLADWNLLVVGEDGKYQPTMNVCDIWSEAVQYQASLEADFKRICVNEMELFNLKWHPIKGFRSDKLARFRGIMGLFEQRKIVFNRYRGFMTMFDELTNFGTSAHDDCVDSLVHLVNGLMRRGTLELDY